MKNIFVFSLLIIGTLIIGNTAYPYDTINPTNRFRIQPVKLVYIQATETTPVRCNPPNNWCCTKDPTSDIYHCNCLTPDETCNTY